MWIFTFKKRESTFPQKGIHIPIKILKKGNPHSYKNLKNITPYQMPSIDYIFLLKLN